MDCVFPFDDGNSFAQGNLKFYGRHTPGMFPAAAPAIIDDIAHPSALSPSTSASGVNAVSIIEMAISTKNAHANPSLSVIASESNKSDSENNSAPKTGKIYNIPIAMAAPTTSVP